MSKLVSFKLDDKGDRDLIRWLASQSNRSEAIREALREHLQGNGVTLGDVLQAVRDLEHKVKAGAVIVGEGGSIPGDEPPDVAAALDALADL
jgi:Arc/MetJ-type ribon-helix-helix transcriptional regulator